MTKNQLPEGVGKKIVEALKKQSDIEINPVIEEDEEILGENPSNLEYLESVIADEVNENINTSAAPSLENIITEESPVGTESPQFTFNYETPIIPEQLNMNRSYQMPEETTMNPTIPQSQSYDMPANVAVLKRLISQLPAGVAKQTGAQIIRQTIEALGISMSNVLQEAQHLQDSLNGSIKDCMSKVQEYKTNIMHLERHAQDYQRQVAQINDLVSLFILTDNNK